MATFGQKLREAIGRRKLTQVDAARLLGIKQQSLTYYLDMVKPPRPKDLKWLAESLNIRLEELVGADLSVFETPGQYKETHPEVEFLSKMKSRWLKRKAMRPEIELALRIIFEEDTPALIKWLNE